MLTWQEVVNPALRAGAEMPQLCYNLLGEREESGLGCYNTVNEAIKHCPFWKWCTGPMLKNMETQVCSLRAVNPQGAGVYPAPNICL